VLLPVILLSGPRGICGRHAGTVPGCGAQTAQTALATARRPRGSRRGFAAEQRFQCAQRIAEAGGRGPDRRVGFRVRQRFARFRELAEECHRDDRRSGAAVTGNERDVAPAARRASPPTPDRTAAPPPRLSPPGGYARRAIQELGRRLIRWAVSP
jgi:hypothetical protein